MRIRWLSPLMMFALFAAACGDNTTETSSDADTSGDTSDDTSTNTADPSTNSTIAGIDSAMWADDIGVTIDGDTLTLTSDGIPNHELADQYAVPADPLNVSADGAMVIDNPVRAQDYELVITTMPVYSETATDTDLGLIGLLISGGALYDPYEAGGGVALDANFDVNGVLFIDSCNGHPQQVGAYHYHGVPYCVTDVIDTPGEHSAILGVLLDGFPVYGPQDNGGDAPTDLDGCNGHAGSTPEFPDGIYHYHLTETGVYSIPCYHGVLTGTAGGAGAGAAPATGAAPDDAPDLAAAADRLGVTEQALQAALGRPPPDLETAAATLGVAMADLRAALGPAPG